MVVFIFEAGKMYKVNDYEYFVKVRPYTGAIGSGEGFCFFSCAKFGSLSYEHRKTINGLAFRLCEVFSKTGLSKGKGGSGVRMDEWFLINEHSKEEKEFYRIWNKNLNNVFLSRLRTCGCSYLFLGSVGLRRMLDLVSFRDCKPEFFNTSCEFYLPEGPFDEYLARRRMFLAVKPPFSDDVRLWLGSVEKELSSLCASVGPVSDVLYAKLFDFYDFATYVCKLDVKLLSSQEVQYLKRFGGGLRGNS